MHDLIDAAKEKGLFVAQTLKCDIFVLHTSKSGYGIFSHAVFKGTIGECLEVLDGK